MPDTELGAAVRELRLAAGFSQEELADRAQLHTTFVSRVETGAVNPSWGSVLLLCRGLDVSLSELAALVEKLERGR